MKYKITFKSEIIESFMKKEGLNKTQFAKKCGISLHILNKLLRGECPISFRYILKLHDLLQISIDDMFVIEEMNNYKKK